MTITMLQYASYQAPFAQLYACFNATHLIRLEFTVDDPTHYQDDCPAFISTHLDNYFQGDQHALHKIPFLFTTGTAFQQTVWRSIQSIAFGQTNSYQGVAQAIGSPKAYRAIGQALRVNPLLLAVPCHRVIQTSGKLGGFNGANEGYISYKKWLLQHETAIQTLL